MHKPSSTLDPPLHIFPVIGPPLSRRALTCATLMPQRHTSRPDMAWPSLSATQDNERPLFTIAVAGVSSTALECPGVPVTSNNPPQDKRPLLQRRAFQDIHQRTRGFLCVTDSSYHLSRPTVLPKLLLSCREEVHELDE